MMLLSASVCPLESLLPMCKDINNGHMSMAVLEPVKVWVMPE